MHPKSARLAMALLCLLGAGSIARSDPPSEPAPGVDPETQATTRALLDEIDKHSQLMPNLEYLCDMIGPRLTGSPKMNQASLWTQSKFREYGLDAKLEGWKIARAWKRGTATGRVVAPTEQRLLLESAGWSPSTVGPVRGPVVFPRGDEVADVAAYKGKLKGAWVITEPVSVHVPPNRMAHAPAHDDDDEDEVDTPGELAFREAFDALMIEEGAAGYLRDSEKEHGLIRMAGSSDDFTPSRFPEAFLTTESYGLIWRLLKHGPVEVEIDLKNEFSPGEVQVFNTVAELRGTEKPDEVVILGGHLDSWDLGTGATDNGTGCMAVLEAARALKAIGARPRRTIRFVLFAGEEEGRHGSKEYVRAHAPEMSRVSAVLIQDMGTGRVRNIALQGRYDLREMMDRVVAPFQEELGLEELSLRKTGGTDHLSFHPFGVPAFAVRQELAEYFKTHHTESDTFDKVYPDAMSQSAKVLAAWAYNVAMLPDCLPRSPEYARSLLIDPARSGDKLASSPKPSTPAGQVPPAPKH